MSAEERRAAGPVASLARSAAVRPHANDWPVEGRGRAVCSLSNPLLFSELDECVCYWDGDEENILKYSSIKYFARADNFTFKYSLCQARQRRMAVQGAAP